MSAPSGWTEDMSVEVPVGVTLESLVTLVLQRECDGTPYETTIAELVSLGLSRSDAELAHDRTLGGVVRAASNNSANEPLRGDDPVAWTSYRFCLRDPTLIQRLQPDAASPPRPLNQARPQHRTVPHVVIGLMFVVLLSILFGLALHKDLSHLSGH